MALVCAAAACALLLALMPVRAQGQSRTDAASIQAVRQAIFEAEERRAPADADVQTLREGTRHPNEAVQRQAVRALGRLERPALAGDIQPLLSSPFASVRAAAAEALGQSASGASPDVAVAVQASLIKQLAGERDQAVIGSVCWTLGRLPYGTAQAARSAEVTLLVASLPLDADPRRAHGAASRHRPRIRVAAAAQREAVHAVTGNGQAADADGARAAHAAPQRRGGGHRPRAPAGDGRPRFLEAGRRGDHRLCGRRPGRTGASARADGHGRRPARIDPGRGARQVHGGRSGRPRLPGALRGPAHPRPVADRRVRGLGPGVRGAGGPVAARRVVRHRSALGVSAAAGAGRRAAEARGRSDCPGGGRRRRVAPGGARAGVAGEDRPGRGASAAASICRQHLVAGSHVRGTRRGDLARH